MVVNYSEYSIRIKQKAARRMIVGQLFCCLLFKNVGSEGFYS